MQTIQFMFKNIDCSFEEKFIQQYNDPYLVFKGSIIYYVTPVAKKNGRFPFWTENFQINLQNEKQLEIECLDYQIEEDEKIGSTRFLVDDLIKSRKGHISQQLRKGLNVVGVIRFDFEQVIQDKDFNCSQSDASTVDYVNNQAEQHNFDENNQHHDEDDKATVELMEYPQKNYQIINSVQSKYPEQIKEKTTNLLKTSIPLQQTKNGNYQNAIPPQQQQIFQTVTSSQYQQNIQKPVIQTLTRKSPQIPNKSIGHINQVPNFKIISNNATYIPQKVPVNLINNNQGINNFQISSSFTTGSCQAKRTLVKKF